VAATEQKVNIMTPDSSPSPRRAKRRRAPASGRRLSRADAAIVKTLLDLDYRQQDVAAIWGVNSGRISDIATGNKFADVPPASEAELNEFMSSRRPLH
jgi:hypothetical protein